MKSDDDDFLHDLQGNTLLVYWHLLQNRRPHSAREIQKRTGLSSPSLALHHLNKLIDLGLVGTDQNGEYIITKTVRPGLLSLFVGSGRILVPRFSLYAVFNTSLLLASVYIFWSEPTPATILLLTVLTTVSIELWFETLRLWHQRPV